MYENPFLGELSSILPDILRQKHVRLEKLKMGIIDEEKPGFSLWDARDVAQQLAPNLNHLTIFTNRPVYFQQFAETMYEENGLLVMLFPKKELFDSRDSYEGWLLLDFEWSGNLYPALLKQKSIYIPIYKTSWKQGDNLDITVPFGYNTVIVEGSHRTQRNPVSDRFDAEFYGYRDTN